MRTTRGVISILHKIPSLQLFIQDASGAAAWAANTPGDDFWGMPLVVWFYITSLCAGAIDYLATGIHQLSEWVQQPGELLQNICPADRMV